VSSTAVRLLQAAAEIVGGERELAARLGIREVLLARYLFDARRVPDPLLLRAVDIVLAHRQPQPVPAQPAPRVGDLPT
jgi:hypothetical protein